MLITIFNLPSDTRYRDVKSLIKSKCGLTDIIVDNREYHGKNIKVTVGVAREEDAAILVRHINGLYVKGQQLYVEDVRQKKPSEQPYTSSNYSNNQYFQNQNYQTSENCRTPEGYQAEVQTYMTHKTMQTTNSDQLQKNCAQYSGHVQTPAPVPSPFARNSSRLDQVLTSSFESRVAYDDWSGDYNSYSENAHRSRLTQSNRSELKHANENSQRDNNSNRSRDRYRSRSPHRDNGSIESSVCNLKRETNESYLWLDSSRQLPYYQLAQRSIDTRNDVPKNSSSYYRDDEDRRSSGTINPWQKELHPHRDTQQSNRDQTFGLNFSQTKTSIKPWAYKPLSSLDKERSDSGETSTRNFSTAETTFKPWGDDYRLCRETKSSNASQTQTIRDRQERIRVENVFAKANVAKQFQSQAAKVYGDRTPNSGAKYSIPQPKEVKGFLPAKENGKMESNMIQTKLKPVKGGNMKVALHRDATWRQQATSAIAKEIYNKFIDHIPKMLYTHCMLKRLKVSVSLRIKSLELEVGVPEKDIIIRYRMRYPPSEDKAHFEAVVKKYNQEYYLGEPQQVINKANPSRPSVKPKKVVKKIKANKTNASKTKSLPKHPAGDEKKPAEQKQKSYEELQNLKNLEPVVNNALDEELHVICKIIMDEFHSPKNEQDRAVCSFILEHGMEELKKALKVDVARRILNVRTYLYARVYTIKLVPGPRPEHDQLIQFLKPYGVTSIKKSEGPKWYWLAQCDTFEHYDRLCDMKDTLIDKTTKLLFRPFEKAPRGPKMSSAQKKKLEHINNRHIGEVEDQKGADQLQEVCIKEGNEGAYDPIEVHEQDFEFTRDHNSDTENIIDKIYDDCEQEKMNKFFEDVNVADLKEEDWEDY